MKSIQYTVRDIPESLDRALRSRAARERQSLNAAALHVLAIGLGLGTENPSNHDLDGVAGSWVEDPALEAALAEMDTVDSEMWQ